MFNGSLNTLSTGLTRFQNNLNIVSMLSGAKHINTDTSVNGNLSSTLDANVYGKVGQGTNLPESALKHNWES